MLLKTILNHIEKHPSFVYGKIELVKSVPLILLVEMLARRNSRPVCSGCWRGGPHYDTLSKRRFQYVPLWGIAVFLVYARRRVNCRNCGVVVEAVPWCEGKRHTTTSFEWFLAQWARRLSWTEVATVFHTSWETVFRAVERAVSYGRAHANYDGIHAIGIDEIQWRLGHVYLTLVYQIDAYCIRLLWIGQERKAATLNSFFEWLGEQRTGALRLVCSDMWKPYLKVVAKRAGHVLHILDRFHIIQHMNKAIDKVRASEARALRAKGQGDLLKNTRWALLRRPVNRTPKDRLKLAEITRYNLRSLRCSLLRDSFQSFWQYTSATWAGKFLDSWCTAVMRSQIEPMKKVARMIRTHRSLLLNWFAAKAMSSGIVEGCNNKAKLTMRKAYGFRTFRAIEVALYHALGHLPDLPIAHRFC
jgi:transposase